MLTDSSLSNALELNHMILVVPNPSSCRGGGDRGTDMYGSNHHELNRALMAKGSFTWASRMPIIIDLL